MATCKNCGKSLIISGGKCAYCGADLVEKKGAIEQKKWYLRNYSIDIVFCVDCTCSMAPVLDSIKENIISFIDVCDDSSVDWRARIVVFRDSEVDEEWLENDNPFVSSKEDLVPLLRSVKAKGCVEDEQDASSSLDALYYAATKSDWRYIRFPGGPLDTDYKEFCESGGCYGFMFIVGFTDAKPRQYHPIIFEEIAKTDQKRKSFKHLHPLMPYDMIYKELIFAPKSANYKSIRPKGGFWWSAVEEFEDPIEFYYHKELDFSPIYSVLSHLYT